jgi:hypothetical protein
LIPSRAQRLQIGAQTEKDREEEGLRKQRSNAVQQDDNAHAVLTAKIYCTFVCFVDLFQSILMYGGQRLKFVQICEFKTREKKLHVIRT